MKQFTLDLHIHSKYSRACSKHLELPLIARACEERGIDIVVTGDMTHPKWFAHIVEHLVEDGAGTGVYKLKDDSSKTRFLLGTEVAVIKKDKGKTRRVHHCLFAPNLAAAERLNKRLGEMGFNLHADGRPILGLTSKQLLEICLDVDEAMHMIPAHVWTPWFGLFGSKGGYDSIEEAFDELTPHIRAVETGLSSDPLMNWRCSWLDGIALVSNSDAHSPQKLGREANVIALDETESLSYATIFSALFSGGKKRFPYTIEFYPEEGKYHASGHRECNVMLSEKEVKRVTGMCPVCKRPLTLGVLHRVEELADRTAGEAQLFAERSGRTPFRSIVPLPEILADLFECGVATKRVATAYKQLLDRVGSEFYILLHATEQEIAKASDATVAHAVLKMRSGKIAISSGYDGVFGTVSIFQKGESRGLPTQGALV